MQRTTHMRPGLGRDRSSGDNRSPYIRVRNPDQPVAWPRLQIVRKVNAESSDNEPWRAFLDKFGKENGSKGTAFLLGAMALIIVGHEDFDAMFSARYDRKPTICRRNCLQKFRQIATGFNSFVREEGQTIRNTVLDINVLACGIRDLPADASNSQMADQLAAWTAQDKTAKAGCSNTVGGSLLWTHGSCMVQRFEPFDGHWLSLNLIGNEDLFRERKEIGDYFRDEGFNASKLEHPYHPGIPFFRTFGVAGQQMFRMTDYDLPQSITLTPPQAVVIA